MLIHTYLHGVLALRIWRRNHFKLASFFSIVSSLPFCLLISFLYACIQAYFFFRLMLLHLSLTAQTKHFFPPYFFFLHRAYAPDNYNPIFCFIFCLIRCVFVHAHMTLRQVPYSWKILQYLRMISAKRRILLRILEDRFESYGCRKKTRLYVSVEYVLT